MRYTTVIDVSEMPEVYRSVNARLLYLHMALKSGWHDDDRDRLRVSLRQLASDCGLTLSATRHAVAVLTKAKLLARDAGGTWHVRKWHLDAPPSPRPRKQQAAAAAAAGDIGKQAEKQMSEYQAKVMKAVRESTKEELAAWLGELEEHRSLRHHGVYLNANQANTEWLRSVIAKMN